MRIFTLITSKISIWAPKLTRQMTACTIWICQSNRNNLYGCFIVYMKHEFHVSVMSRPMTNHVGLTSVLVTLYRKLQWVLSKTIRVGDTTPQFTLSIEQVYWELETPNIIYSVVEIQDFRKKYISFGRNSQNIFQIKKKKPERCQHVTGWTWKYTGLNRLCPKISPNIDPNNTQYDYSLIWDFFGILR